MSEAVAPLRWNDLSKEVRAALSGKLNGLWGAMSDQRAFDELPVDKQQALLLLLDHLWKLGLWELVKRVDNVYGSGGVGIDFTAWPYIETTLSRRKDFTRRFAKRKRVSGGFYEKGRPEAVLHFLFTEGEPGSPRRWHVHFDRFNPLWSLSRALKHVRYEHFGKLRPDWKMIQSVLETSRRHKGF